MRLVFDIEADGLLDTITKIHCIVIKDIDTGERWSVWQPELIEWVVRNLLQEADLLIGHNILSFDLHVLLKFFPWFKPKGKFFDTINASRLIWTDLYERDLREVRQNPALGPKMGWHSLEAWGIRLKLHKGDFGKRQVEEGEESVWATWSPAMQSYCERDVLVTCRLYSLIASKNYSPEALQLEFDFQWVISLQEQTGFAFDEAAAQSLYSTLCAERQRRVEELQKVFAPRTETMKTPAYCQFQGGSLREETKGALQAELKRRGIKFKPVDIAPGPMKVRLIPFNPNSRKQVAERLTEKYGWKPTVFTPTGEPQIDEETIGHLPYPECKTLIDLFLITKRIGQVAEGPKSWLKNVKNGRLYGRITTNGAVTGRCTHKLIANVPKPPAPYGQECRECFVESPGWFLVGCDAAGLEARCLANFMFPYDDGAYTNTVLLGDKASGTDIHTVNQKAAGLLTRDAAKTWFYAFLYGAGDELLGFNGGVTLADVIPYKEANPKKWQQVGASRQKRNLPTDDLYIAACLKGAELRDRFLKATPALASLISDIKEDAKVNGFLTGLDGRRLHVRSQHSALNTFLQSAGALVMKKALCLLHYRELPKWGWVYGKDYRFVTNYHDEIQSELPESRRPQAKEYGDLVAKCITMAGEHFKFLCRLDGEAKVGRNWFETH